MKQRRRWRKISLFDGRLVVCEAEALPEIPLQELKKNPGDVRIKEHLSTCRKDLRACLFFCLFVVKLRLLSQKLTTKD